jgi:hypothetical protein
LLFYGGSSLIEYIIKIMSELLNIGEVDYPKRKKRALLVESISKNNFLRKQIIIEDRKQIIKKWALSGLLDGFDKKTKANVAQLYESEASMLLSYRRRNY